MQTEYVYVCVVVLIGPDKPHQQIYIFFDSSAILQLFVLCSQSLQISKTLVSPMTQKVKEAQSVVDDQASIKVAQLGARCERRRRK